MFHEKYLKRGERGGEQAADELMAKVRECLSSFIAGAQSIPVMVKCYAYLIGLTKAYVKRGIGMTSMELNQFMVGFTRRYALFDFVDVGAGKEEADSKIRGKFRPFWLEGVERRTKKKQLC
jgi:hypothetical protein